MMDWDDRAIEDEAGNGAYELRNWLATFGAVGPCRPRPLAYVACPNGSPAWRYPARPRSGAVPA